MATVYRVVRYRADDTIVDWKGPFRSSGQAKAVLRNERKTLSSANPSAAVKAEIQTLTAEWERPGAKGLAAEWVAAYDEEHGRPPRATEGPSNRASLGLTCG